MQNCTIFFFSECLHIKRGVFQNITFKQEMQHALLQFKNSHVRKTYDSSFF